MNPREATYLLVYEEHPIAVIQTDGTKDLIFEVEKLLLSNLDIKAEVTGMEPKSGIIHARNIETMQPINTRLI